MKISDIIFRFQGISHRDGLCRVRIFVNNHQQVVALITDLGDLNPSGSVTNYIEVIVGQLSSRLIIPKSSIIIEHYEPAAYHSDSFDIVTIEGKNPEWKSISFTEALGIISCSEEEIKNYTYNNEVLLHEIEKLRVQINPHLDFPRQVDSTRLLRQLAIEKSMLPKSEIQKLIHAGCNEREIQLLLKQDLSIFAEAYASPADNYICFSEFPLDGGCIDFAIFTGRSRMDVILIEVKGADFNIINQSGYQKFNAKIDTAASQIRNRLGYIHRNMESFRQYAHEIREKVIAGKSIYNSFPGPEAATEVDRNKDINIHNVIIGGRTVDDLSESKIRHDFENYFGLPIKLDSWDSFLKKLRRQ